MALIISFGWNGSNIAAIKNLVLPKQWRKKRVVVDCEWWTLIFWPDIYLISSCGFGHCMWVNMRALKPFCYTYTRIKCDCLHYSRERERDSRLVDCNEVSIFMSCFISKRKRLEQRRKERKNERPFDFYRKPCRHAL